MIGRIAQFLLYVFVALRLLPDPILRRGVAAHVALDHRKAAAKV